MPVTNNLKPQVDLPVWEWMRFNPITNTSATTALTTARDGSSRYLFYYESTNNSLWKYDTQADSWYQLSNAGITAATLVSAKYVKNQGYRGNVLSVPSSNQLQIPSVGGQNLAGYQIKIISGTGAGQIRTITATAPEVTHDQGLLTGTSISSTLNQITDSTKKYKNNQWVGYAVRVIFGTGNNQFREILYNDSTTLTTWDLNYEARNFLSAQFSNATPYANPVSTAGVQSVYEIASQVITVDSPWTVTPDANSKFMIMSGGIWFLTGGTNFLWYYYDILSDRWVQKVAPGSATLLSSNLSADAEICPTNDIVGNFFTASFTTGTSQSIDTASLTPGEWIGSVVRILSGSGSGQERRIISNTSSSLVLSSKWDIMPVSGSSIYSVTGENAIYLTGNQQAKLLKYYPEPSIWVQSNIIDDGIPLNLALIRPTNIKQSHGVNGTSIRSFAMVSINSTPTAGGSGYVVGDILTVSGGTFGRVYVESVSATGAVLSVSIYTCGTAYTVASGIATTGGTGTGCTIQILSLGTVALITSAIANDFRIGDIVVFSGANDPAWNTTCTVVGFGTIPAQFEITTAATANAVANYTQVANTLVDVTKNWIPGEHCGKVLIGGYGSSLATSIAIRKIIGNTTNTITTNGTLTFTTGFARYAIADLEAFGDDKQYLADVGLNYGYPTSASLTTITDTSKNWTFNATASAWYGYKVQLYDVSGSYTENIIVGNTSSSLSLGRTVAVGSGTNTIAYSDLQGSSSAWTGLSTTIFNTSGNGVIWNGSRYVAVGTSTALNTIAWSNDGAIWNGIGQTVFTTAGNGIAWNGRVFVAVGSGTNTIATSTDATSFTGLGTTIFSTQGNAVAWNGTRFVVVGQGTNTIAHASDTGSFGASSFIGLGTSTFSTAGRGVCWAGTRFVAVGNGTNTIATSSANGTSFTGIGTSIFSTQGNAVAWNGDITVAVGQGTNTIAYSTDSGSTWTGIGTSIFSTSGNSITWNGTYWVAGGSGTNTTAWSLDGINWTGNGLSIITTQVNGITSTTPFQSVVPSIGLTPNTNTRYKIQDSYGTATAGSTTTLTDASKRWKVNQWAGKRVLITTGTGYNQELTITSNTVNQLTFATSTAPDATSTYTIIGRSPAGSGGTTLQWNWGSTDTTNKGKLLILNKGSNVHTWDIFDIRTNRFLPFLFVEGAREGLTSGTMYAYDGGDRIYYQINATGRINYYDIKKNKIEAFSTIPYGMSTAVISNRMEIIKTDDGLDYLYIMRHTGTEMWRTLIYY